MSIEHPIRRTLRSSPSAAPVNTNAKDIASSDKMPSARPTLSEALDDLHIHTSGLHDAISSLEARLPPVLHERVACNSDDGSSENVAPQIASTVLSVQNLSERITFLTRVVKNIESELALT